MNQINPHLFWKIVYLGGIGVLLVVLAFLALPATTDEGQVERGQLVGVLTQMRANEGLSQSDLGKIEPASEAARLGSLGMYGFAAAYLWHQAADQKKREDFPALRQTTNQLARLQPNFPKVWDFQAHNLSYNISVEFDDYRDRYRWVKEGIYYYLEGNQYNRDNPELLNMTGWFTGHKFGRSDEKLSFRRLLKDDHEFVRQISDGATFIDSGRAIGRDGYDNWLLSQLWYDRGVAVIDASGRQPRKGLTMYLADAFRPKFNYATDLEEDFPADEFARQAWDDAYRTWEAFGRRSLDTSWGILVTLDSYDRHLARIAELQEELDQIVPGARQRLLEEQLAKLTPLEREAWETAPEDRSVLQQQRVNALAPQLQVNDRTIAEQAPSERRGEALRLVDQLSEQKDRAYIVEKSWDVIQYGYWLERADAERTETAIAARLEMFRAHEAKREFDYARAIDHYAASFGHWNTLLREFPKLLDGVLVSEIRDEITDYLDTINFVGQEPPASFPLLDLINRRSEEMGEEAVPLPGQRGSDPSGAAAAAPSGDTPAAEQPGVETPTETPSDSPAEAPSELTAPASPEAEPTPSAEPSNMEESSPSAASVPAEPPAASSEEPAPPGPTPEVPAEPQSASPEPAPAEPPAAEPDSTSSP